MVLLLGLLNLFYGEIVPAGNGFGWDGVIYADMTKKLPSIINEGALSSYYAQRMLPSCIVRGMLLISGSSFSNSDIILGFQLYNLLVLVISCFAWKKIADNFLLSLGGRWIGFCGLFLNFQCSKQNFYLPVTTDGTALLLGLLLLLFYIEKRSVALLVTTIAGAFAWQVVSISGALLLIFMKAELPAEVISPAPSTAINAGSFHRHMWRAWLAILIGVVISLVSLHIMESSFGITTLGANINLIEEFLTGLPSLVGLIISLVMLVGSGKFIKAVFNNLSQTPFMLIVLAFLAVLIPKGIVHTISNPSLPNANSFGQVLIFLLFPPNGKLLLPLVTLTSFWGPVVLLLLLNWKQFCIEARKLGPGFVAVLCFSLPLGLVTEPRYITLAWPFLVLGIVLAMENLKMPISFKYVFTILTILFAQFWMKINLAPWSHGDSDLLYFPKQVLYMHYGYWMNWSAYLLQLLVMVVGILLLQKSLLVKANYNR
jgi:hypothetical protein